MLKEKLSLKNVAVNVEAKDWRDATTKAGQLLLAADYIEESFINNMIEVIEKEGPYVVIDKGIALVHATPCNTVKDVGISFMVLKTPVEFGNEINDPAKLIIGLCAPDNHSHLELMGELAQILGDRNTVRKIFNAQTKIGLVYLLKKECKKIQRKG